MTSHERPWITYEDPFIPGLVRYRPAPTKFTSSYHVRTEDDGFSHYEVRLTLRAWLPDLKRGKRTWRPVADMPVDLPVAKGDFTTVFAVMRTLRRYANNTGKVPMMQNMAHRIVQSIARS